MIDEVEDGLHKFNDQLKVFRWEMLIELVLKCKLAWLQEFYVILSEVEWVVSLSLILTQEKSVPMDGTTINKVLGVPNPSNT